MITKHRNRGLIQLAAALSLTVLLIYMIWKGKSSLRLGHLNDNWLVLAIFVYLSAVTLWMSGSFSLAKAKGHRSDTIGSVFLFLFLVGFCIPIAPLIFPGFVIFGLKDKTQRRRHH